MDRETDNDVEADSKTGRCTFTLGALILVIVPLVALGSGLAVVGGAHVSLEDQERYLRHQEFWGGNPAEVFSHWLDVVLMSGNAGAIAWLLSVEAFFQRNRVQQKWLVRLAHACALLGVILSGAIALALDGSHGEGTVLIAYPLFFLPILGSSYYLLRQSAALVHWRLAVVVVLSATYAGLHTLLNCITNHQGLAGPAFGLFQYGWAVSDVGSFGHSSKAFARADSAASSSKSAAWLASRSCGAAGF